MVAAAGLTVTAAIAGIAVSWSPARSDLPAPGPVTVTASPSPDKGCPTPALPSAERLRELTDTTAAVMPIRLTHTGPAREPLRRVAATITASDCDAQTGPYTLIHTREWDVSGSGVTRPITITEQARWRAPDGSGRILTARGTSGGIPTTTDRTYPAGGIAPVLAFPPRPDDVGILAEQLGVEQSAPDGPTRLIRTVVSVNRGDVPNLRYRAALLTLLKDTDDLKHHGRITDRAGRTGLAVSTTSRDGTARDLLIVRDRTGEVLAYERAHRAGRTVLSVQTYLLFLAHTHTTTTT